MRRTLVLLLIALPLIAAPFVLAAGGPAADEPVTPAPLREGDVLRYEFVGESEGADGAHVATGTRVLQVEGAADALDGFGIRRETVAFLEEAYADEELSYAFRCHVLADGVETVRTDVLHGSLGMMAHSGTAETSGVAVGAGESSARLTNTTTSFDDRACATNARIDLQSLNAGDRVPYAALAPSGRAADVLSEPAVPAEFEGRRALMLEYDLRALFEAGRTSASSPGGFDVDGVVRLTVADGLPGVVLRESHANWTFNGDTWRMHDVQRLAGLERGEGDAVALGGDARLPERNPDVDMPSYDPLVFDDSAYDLPYHYAEAMDALRDDPIVGLDAWLAEHPDAWLISASYDRHEKGSRASMTNGDTDGAWTLFFATREGDVFFARSARAAATPTPGGATLPDGLPDPRVENFGGESRADDMPLADFVPPARMMDSQQALDVSGLHGAAPSPVQTLEYFLMGEGEEYTARLVLSNAGDSQEGAAEGLTLTMDPIRGAVSEIGSTIAIRSSHGILGASTGASTITFAAGPTRVLGILVAPEVGTGLAAGSVATGVALLLVAAKLALAPLYTRLVRDRLLDNPVRARLYDRVRAEPGIRLHELIEFGGVGEGATRRHLDQLARHRFLVVMREGGHRAYYAAGEVPPDVARQAAVLRSDTNRRVYELVRAEPNLTLRDAAARLGVSAPLVHRAKKKLEAAGLLPPAREAGVALTES